MRKNSTNSSFASALQSGIFVVSVMFNASIGVIAVWFVLRPGVVHVPLFRPATVIKPPAVEYKDFVAILLTALGVMIALASGLIGVLAIFGYSEGRRMIERLVNSSVDGHMGPALARWQMDQKPSATTPADADRIAQASND